MATSTPAPGGDGNFISVPTSTDDPRISAVNPRRAWPWSPPSASASEGNLGPQSKPELVQAHYFIRHGERTPVRTRLTQSSPPVPARWNLCHTAREFQAALLAVPLTSDTSTSGVQRSVPMKRATEAVDSNGKRAASLEGECLMGELTDLGRSSTLTMGRHLRNIYVHQLGLLPEQLQSGRDDEKIYIRSTNMSRTIESAQQVARGLLGEASERNNFRPTILVRNGNVESLLPNTYSCPTLYKLDAHFSRSVATLLNPSLAVHDALLSPHMAGAPLRIDGHPRLSGVLDTVRAAQAHGIPVPAVFQRPEVVRDLERAVCDEWFSGYRAEDADQRSQYRRLAMGPLLEDLADRLSEAASSKDPKLKLGIYSTHDTTLAGIMSTLDVFDRRWPAFTASIGVELWHRPSPSSRNPATYGASQSHLVSFVVSTWERLGEVLSGNSTDTSSKHYDNHSVRVLYDGRPLLLPGCDKKELCPLPTFLGLVKSLQKGNDKKLTWEAECALGRGERSSK